MFARTDRPAPGPAPRNARRRAFALPLAVLALAVATAAIVASYSATSAEVVSNNALRAQQRAHQLAEVGLQQFLLRRNETGFCTNCVSDPAVADSEWTRVSLTGGYADVVAMRVRDRKLDGTAPLFFVRSMGTDTSVRLSGAGRTVFATRTVGQYATFGSASVKPLGAFASLNGITLSTSGSRVPVVGSDDCSSTTLAGAVIPAGGNLGGSGTRPTGAPPVDSSMSLDSLKKRVGIDWNAIIRDNAIPADITIPPDANWPTAALRNSSYWPIIRIKKSFAIPDDGQGIIIADSNLTFTSNDTWDGIVLVGGTLTVTGSGTISGVVITGLNKMLPTGGPATRDLMTNTKRIQLSSCRAWYAATRLRSYFVWSNTWLDNVAVW